MAYCTSCGNEIDLGTNHCPHCGADVRAELRQITEQEHGLATLSQRAAAIAMDTLIMFMFWGLLVFLIGVSVLSGDSPGLGVFWAALFTELIFVVGYTVLLEGYWNGQTVGKKVFDIRVVDADSGQPITIDEAVVRNVARLVDFLPMFYLVAIAAVAMTESSQRLGDLAANTLVVNVR